MTSPRFARVRQVYPDANDETIQRYLDLRDEGYDQYRASLMAGMADPEDDGRLACEDEDAYRGRTRGGI